MLENLFTVLSAAVEGNAAIALSASFAWGVLSILLSPCHLSSIPLIVGFIDDQGHISTKRAFTIALSFASGILISIAVIGFITGFTGRMLGDVGKYGNYFVACIFFLVGLYLFDLVPTPWSGLGKIDLKRKGALAAFILGFIFGIALGPCTFAYMAPILSITFQLSASQMWYGVTLLLAYAVGHCSIIVLAGTFTELVQQYLNWNEQSKGPMIVKKVCGALVILGGCYLIYTTL